MKTRVAILGSTGSIGVNALKVISDLGNKLFDVVALSADTNIWLLSEEAKRFSPKIVSVRDERLAKELKKTLRKSVKVSWGIDGLSEIVRRKDVDLIIFATSGISCTIPLIEAIKLKKRIALANKESMVSAGGLITKLADRHGVKIIPIDSEHSAILQCLEGRQGAIKKIYLTGSGGPLLNISEDVFDKLSQRFVLDHPKWKMGKKISVDSATMMNKGLEIIEAKWLFDVDEAMIDVVVHPEAIIHSMVEFVDGSVLAQMGSPDMRAPIQYALTYPKRLSSHVEPVNFLKTAKMTFRMPDLKKFPALGLAREALKKGGTYPAVLNAADDEAVMGYLDGRIKFTQITAIIEKVLKSHKMAAKNKELSMDDIMAAEGWARKEARSFCYL